MNSKKKKLLPIILKWLKRLLIAGTIFFAAGFALMYFILLDQPTQELVAASIEGKQIENSPFYITYNDELNASLALLSQERMDEVLWNAINSSDDYVIDVKYIDVEKIQALGIEIQENMSLLNELVHNLVTDYDWEYEDEIANLKSLEEYTQFYKNLQMLRDLDRMVKALLVATGNEYTLFYSKKKEFEAKDGKFILRYEEPENPSLQKYYNSLKETEIFYPLVESINNMFYFERVHSITFTEGGSINAYFDPVTQNITMHYELMDFIYTALHVSELRAASEAEEIMVDSIFYIMLHELGHAFIDIFDLQFIGKEEDVSDHLAVVLAVELLGHDAEAIVDLLFTAPLFYELFLSDDWKEDEGDEEESKPEKYESIIYSDVHSLDHQRVLDVISLIYGVNPLEGEFLVTNNESRKYRLTQQTVHNSPDIYLDTSNFWYNALFPYMKRKGEDSAKQ